MVAPDSESAPQENSPGTGWRERILSWPFLIRFAIAFGTVFLLKFLNPTSSPDDAPGSLLGVPGLYQTVLSQLSRREASRSTAVLEIDAGEMGSDKYSGLNVCSQRLYMSELLRALAEHPQHPNVIVIDKFFGAATCKGSEAGEANTAALNRAISEARVRGITVVTGLRLRQADAVDPKKLTGLKASQRAAVRYIEPALHFDHAVSGVVNLAANHRQSPLLFVGMSPADGSVTEYESIAWKAAHAFDPLNMDSLRKRFEPTDDKAPFVGFLRSEVTKSHTFSALNAICALAPQRATSLDLNCTGASGFAPESVQNRVAIIGERLEADIHDSPIGKVHGYFLHANYIESLLDGRYYFPAPGWVNFLVGILMFVAVEVSFFYLEKLRGCALVLTIPFLCVMLFGVEFLFAQVFHSLLLPFSSLAQFATQLLDRLGERLVVFLHKPAQKG